mmetsp:Transcript_17529/g.66727  ORF Transcript_17529/g.66727 Transcript_17529/m.66727 type:complete len:130 (+) Transcript_17529:48-437(+)
MMFRDSDLEDARMPEQGSPCLCEVQVQDKQASRQRRWAYGVDGSSFMVCSFWNFGWAPPSEETRKSESPQTAATELVSCVLETRRGSGSGATATRSWFRFDDLDFLDAFFCCVLLRSAELRPLKPPRNP